MASFNDIVAFLEHQETPPGDIPVQAEIFSYLHGKAPTNALVIAGAIDPASNPFWTVEVQRSFLPEDIAPHLDALVRSNVLTLSLVRVGMYSLEYWGIHDDAKRDIAPYASDSATESEFVVDDYLKTPGGEPILRHPSVADHLLFNSEHPDCEGYFLSNWYNDRQHSLKAEYWCAEQHFLVKKLRFCSNRVLASKILSAILAIQPVDCPHFRDPSFDEAWGANHEKARAMKALCRDRSLGLLVDVWNANKYDVLVGVLRDKFDLFDRTWIAERLLATSPKLLAEANPDDTEFGIGLQPGVHRPRNKEKFAAKSALVLDGCWERWRIPPTAWRGKNLLGKALMQVRSSMTTPSWCDSWGPDNDPAV